MTKDRALRRALLICETAGAGFAAALIDRCVRQALAPITGALVQTESHVAAIVEADEFVISALCELIEHDWPTCRRSHDHGIARRAFAGWSAPDVGDATLVQRLVDDLLADPSEDAVRRVEQLAMELARASGLPAS